MPPMHRVLAGGVDRVDAVEHRHQRYRDVAPIDALGAPAACIITINADSAMM